MFRVRRSSSSSLFLLTLTCAVAATAACEYATADGWVRQPFEGPQFSLDDGLAGEWPDDHQFVVSTTYLPVTPEGVALFDEKMGPINDHLEAAPEGLIGYSLAQRLVGGNEYRTLAVWESYDAMYAFVLSDAHRDALAAASDIAVPGASTVHTYEVDQAGLPPTWEDAMVRLDEDGRDAAY